LSKQLEIALTKIEELVIIKDQLTEDVVRAEYRNSDLLVQVKELSDRIGSEAEERNALSDLINDLKQKNAQLESDFDNLVNEFSEKAKTEQIQNKQVENRNSDLI
jgi:acyl carrier protein phosphodiesterase